MTTSFRKCHILKPENFCPNRDSNPHSSTGDRLGKLTSAPRVTQSIVCGTDKYHRSVNSKYKFLPGSVDEVLDIVAHSVVSLWHVFLGLTY